MDHYLQPRSNCPRGVAAANSLERLAARFLTHSLTHTRAASRYIYANGETPAKRWHRSSSRVTEIDSVSADATAVRGASESERRFSAAGETTAASTVSTSSRGKPEESLRRGPTHERECDIPFHECNPRCILLRQGGARASARTVHTHTHTRHTYTTHMRVRHTPGYLRRFARREVLL